MSNTERTIEFEFVRATENAALNSVHWLGRGGKELADAAAGDAIYGVFDNVNICGQAVIGEGIKDNAPGIFLGDRLGTWLKGSGVDLYVGIGASPEGVLTAAALRCSRRRNAAADGLPG